MDAATIKSNVTRNPIQITLPATSVSKFTGKRIHFIGIGGCGMSGLAAMLMDAGAIVSGSEPNFNAQTLELIRRGAKISRGQIGELLDNDMDLVVRTAAVKDDNLEFRSAKRRQITTAKYAELLGMVMAERFGVAVAGTHGKSTTSAMISFALLECGADPSFVIGGTVPQLSGGSRSGGGNLFVAEACEFDRSFHNLNPTVAIITNIEEDHLDCYKDIEEIVASFRKFARLVPKNGLIIGGGSDPRVLEALEGMPCRIELVGFSPEFDWSVRDVNIVGGFPTGKVFHGDSEVGLLHLSVAGEHNLLNATMAIAAIAACGVSPSAAIEALNRFKGVDRRMSVIGRCNGATVVDDYGHHPTEIRVTLAALRQQYSPRRLICVFQPHQHSRTRFLLQDFAESFTLADQTIVPDIYFVRDSETERQSVNATDLVQRITAHGQAARYISDFNEIVNYLRGTLADGDLLVTMGAGNVWEIGRKLVEQTAQQP